MAIGKNKIISEDREPAAEQYTVETHDGHEVANFIKKDGKLLESSASHAAQDSGTFEEAAKKAKVKKEDLVFTAPSMAAAQSDVTHAKENDDNREAEKAKLLNKSMEIPKSISAMQMDGDLDNPPEMKRQIQLHTKHAGMTNNTEARKWHLDQSEQIYNHMTGKKPYIPPVHVLEKSDEIKPPKPKTHTLNYKEINAPKVNPDVEPKTIDYSKLKDPVPNPNWKKKLALKREAKLKELKAKGMLVKSEEKLQKDVVDLKTRKRLDKPSKKEQQKPAPAPQQEKRSGPAGMFDILSRKNKASDTRSTDEKIKAALEAQSATNPYAQQRNQMDYAAPSKTSQPAAKETKGSTASRAMMANIHRMEQKKKDDSQQAMAESSDLIQRYLARYDGHPETQKHADAFKKYNERGHGEPYAGPSIQSEYWGDHPSDRELHIQAPVYKINPEELQGHLGKHVAKGGADPFAWMDIKYKSTQKALREHGDKIHTISTRSDLISHDDYMNLLDPKKHRINMHISGHIPRLTRGVEGGSPSNSRRLSAAQKLKNAGFDVTLIHDNVNGIPLEPMKDLAEDNPDVNLNSFKHESNHINPNEGKKKALEGMLGFSLSQSEKPAERTSASQRFWSKAQTMDKESKNKKPKK